MISLTDEEKMNFGDRCLNDYTKIDLLGKLFFFQKKIINFLYFLKK